MGVLLFCSFVLLQMAQQRAYYHYAQSQRLT